MAQIINGRRAVHQEVEIEHAVQFADDTELIIVEDEEKVDEIIAFARQMNDGEEPEGVKRFVYTAYTDWESVQK